MNTKIFLSAFFQAIEKRYAMLSDKPEWTGSKWTVFMGEVLDDIGKQANCYVVRRRPDNRNESGEYLNIDGLFFDFNDYKSETDEMDPLVLPRMAVELENSLHHDKIAYCLWKLMCLRTETRVLICYQSNNDKIKDLKVHLEQVILEGNLMKGQDADVLLLIGDESSPEDAAWTDYYSVFKLRDDAFQQVTEMDIIFSA